MFLYAIINPKNDSAMATDGAWLLPGQVKRDICSVCWFPGVDEAKRVASALPERGLSVMGAKNYAKRIGMKQLPKTLCDNSSDYCPKNNDADVLSVLPAGKREVELSADSSFLADSEIIAELKQTLGSVATAEERWVKMRDVLQEHLHALELREQDLLHYVEFYVPDDQSVMKLYGELHELRVERRKIKNELAALGAAIGSVQAMSMSGVRKAMRSIDSLVTQTYKCRTISKNNLPDWLDSEKV